MFRWSSAVSVVTSMILVLSILLACGTTENSSTPKQVEKAQGYFEFKKAVENSKFTTLDGDTVAVSEYRGKVVMIDFWETWCNPCIRSFPGIQKLKEEFPDQFVVLAVTPGFDDDRDDASNFAKNHDYNFEFLMDYQYLHRTLGVKAIPYKLFLDKQGKFVKSSTGSKGPERDYKEIKEIVERYK